MNHSASYHSLWEPEALALWWTTIRDQQLTRKLDYYLYIICDRIILASFVKIVAAVILLIPSAVLIYQRGGALGFRIGDPFALVDNGILLRRI